MERIQAALIDANLRPDEIILSVDLPPDGFAEHHTYLKLRDRRPYAFAFVSIAVGLDMDGDRIGRGCGRGSPRRSRRVGADDRGGRRRGTTGPGFLAGMRRSTTG